MAFLGFHSVWEANAYVTFVLLGMSIMMVLSTVLSAPTFIFSYYKYATGVPDAECENPYFWSNVLTFFFAVMFAVQFTCEALTLTPLVRRIPLRLRLIVGLCIPFIELVTLVVVPIIKIPTQNGAIAMVMALSVLCGLSKAICDSTTNALVGPFPTKFMNGEQWGLAISPLLMSIVEIILKGTMSSGFDDVLKQSRIYLGIGMFFQILTMVELLILHKNPFAQKYNAEFRFRAQMQSIANGGKQDDVRRDDMGDSLNLEKARPGLSGNGVNIQPTGSMNAMTDGIILMNQERKGNLHLEQEKADLSRAGLSDAANNSEQQRLGISTAILQATGDADKMIDIDQVNNVTSSDQMLSVSAVSVVKRVWPMLFCTFFVYFTSLILFPGLFFKVAADMTGWYSVIVIFLFNAGDFMSRILLMFRPLRPSPKCVLIGAFARLLIVPLLALCCAHVIKGEALPYVLVLVLSLTNGYFGVMACVLSPRTPTLSKAGERSLAGILSGLFLMLGLWFGSSAALLVALLF